MLDDKDETMLVEMERNAAGKNKEYNIKQFALQQRNFYVEQSMLALENMNLDTTKKSILKSLVDYLVIRNF